MKKLSILLLVALLATACSNNQTTESETKTQASPEHPTNLVAMLDTIWKMEQEPIRLRDSIMRVHGAETPKANDMIELGRKNHAINEVKITKLLDKYGWPPRELIGYQENLTICNVIQHCSNDIRLKYLPMIHQAVKDKKLEPRLLARAEDRIGTEQGKAQIYGTQIKYYPETKSFNVWPITDPRNVDKRRSEIGLDPMEDFLKRRRFQVEWDVEEQVKRTAEFEKENN